MRKSSKFKSGDIVYFYAIDMDTDINLENIGIFIDRDINPHRPLFICPTATCTINDLVYEYNAVKSFLNIKDNRKLNYWGFIGFEPDKNTHINISDLKPNVLNMLLSEDIEIRNLTLQMLINQKKNGTL